MSYTYLIDDYKNLSDINASNLYAYISSSFELKPNGSGYSSVSFEVGFDQELTTEQKLVLDELIMNYKEPTKNNYYYAMSVAVSATTSTSYITKLTYTTPLLSAGTYRLSYYYDYQQSINTSSVDVRITQNDVTIVANSNIYKNNNVWVPINGVDIKLLDAGVYTYTVSYKASSGIASIRNVIIDLDKVSA